MKNIWQFTSVLLLVLTGCATGARFTKTSSGPGMRVDESAQPAIPAPTLRVTGKTMTDLKRAVSAVYIVDGWNTEKESDQQVVFAKEVNDRAAKRWYNWSPENPVVVRERLTFVEADGAITVTVKQEIVATYGAQKITDEASSYGRTAERFAKIQNSFQPDKPPHLVGSLEPNWFSQVDGK
jgi:hypothetical protein